jgi:hypothetical protein
VVFVTPFRGRVIIAPAHINSPVFERINIHLSGLWHHSRYTNSAAYAIINIGDQA